jgi:hypothetical protein
MGKGAVAEAVYILCAVTSAGCAALLLRAYRRNGTRFLLWSGLCFAFLALNNVLLYVDLSVIPQVDLRLARHSAALAGLSLLVYGLVWGAE